MLKTTLFFIVPGYFSYGRIKTNVDKVKILPDRLSLLANLKITASEKIKIARQLLKTVNFFAILDNIDDLDKFRPTFQVTKNENITRKDEAGKSLSQKLILKKEKYFKTKGGITKR